jgi:hypothetical protein
MNELNTSLYGTLSAATALTALLPGSTSFYYQMPPDNPTYPLVIWNLQGGGDLNMTPKRRKSLVVYIRAYSKVSAAQAGSIDKQIDTLLHGKSLSVSGWANYWLMRESDVELVENPPDGNKIYSAGGFYRVEIEKS